jgi:hypothetical protein
MKANHAPKKWQGIDILPGQFISGRDVMSAETGIGPQSIRTCIERLKSTNELTSKSTNKYTVFTINSWNKYQTTEPTNHQTNQQLTSNQPATNQQLTTNKNEKNEKNEKEVLSETSSDDGSSLEVPRKHSGSTEEARIKEEGIRNKEEGDLSEKISDVVSVLKAEKKPREPDPIAQAMIEHYKHTPVGKSGWSRLMQSVNAMKTQKATPFGIFISSIAFQVKNPTLSQPEIENWASRWYREMTDWARKDGNFQVKEFIRSNKIAIPYENKEF